MRSVDAFRRKRAHVAHGAAASAGGAAGAEPEPPARRVARRADGPLRGAAASPPRAPPPRTAEEVRIDAAVAQALQRCAELRAAAAGEPRAWSAPDFKAPGTDLSAALGGQGAAVPGYCRASTPQNPLTRQDAPALLLRRELDALLAPPHGWVQPMDHYYCHWADVNAGFPRAYPVGLVLAVVAARTRLPLARALEARAEEAARARVARELAQERRDALQRVTDLRRSWLLRNALEAKLRGLLQHADAPGVERRNGGAPGARAAAVRGHIQRQCDALLTANSTEMCVKVCGVLGLDERAWLRGPDVEHLLTCWALHTTLDVAPDPACDARCGGGAAEYVMRLPGARRRVFVGMPVEALPLPPPAALWSRATHRAFPSDFKLAVCTLLLCYGRVGVDVDHNAWALDAVLRLAAPDLERVRLLRGAPDADANAEADGAAAGEEADGEGGDADADGEEAGAAAGAKRYGSLNPAFWVGAPHRFSLMRHVPGGVGGDGRTLCEVAPDHHARLSPLVYKHAPLALRSPYFDGATLECRMQACRMGLLPTAAQQEEALAAARAFAAAPAGADGRSGLIWAYERA
jgi:hypothetical protein